MCIPPHRPTSHDHWLSHHRYLVLALAGSALLSRVDYDSGGYWTGCYRNGTARLVLVLNIMLEIRMKLKFLLAAMLLMSLPAQAQQSFVRCLGYQHFATMSSAQSLTIPAGTGFVLVQCSGQTVNWRADGVTPTGAATGGQPLLVNTPMGLIAGLANFKMIQTSASAVCDATYFG